MVGADGVHSAVRQAVLGRRDPRPALLTTASWRFVTPSTAVRCRSMWLGPDAAFLIIPVDSDHVYGYASATRGGPVSSDPRWLASTFARYADPVAHIVASALAEPSSLYHSPMEEVRAERCSNARAVLIGDAADATAPIWPQGAALAVEDALVLAELLAVGGDWADADGEPGSRGRRGPVGAAVAGVYRGQGSRVSASFGCTARSQSAGAGSAGRAVKKRMMSSAAVGDSIIAWTRADISAIG